MNALLLRLALFVVASSVMHGQVPFDVHAHGAPTSLVIARLWASPDATVVTDVVVAPDSSIYVVGWTNDVNFEAKGQGYRKFHSGGTDGFIARLNPTLDRVLAWTFVGGTGSDTITAMTLRRDGSVVVVGSTTSSDLPTASGSFGQLFRGGVDGFAAVFSPDLGSQRWITYVGAQGNERLLDVAVDNSDFVYACGSTSSSSGFQLPNAYDVTYNGGATDGLIVRLTPTGAGSVASYFGGEAMDEFRALAVTASGGVAVAGVTSSSSFEVFPKKQHMWDFDAKHPFDRSFNGRLDGTITVFNPNIAGLVFSSFLGGSEEDHCTSILVNNRGRIVVAGVTRSPDFPVSAGATPYQGGRDGFVSFVSDDGLQLVASYTVGGSADDDVSALALAGADNVLAVGSSASRSFAQFYGATLSGGSDLFVTHVSPGGLQGITFDGWNGAERAGRFAVDNQGDLFIVGSSTSSLVLGTQLPYESGLDRCGLIAKFVFGSVDLTMPEGGETWCKDQRVNFSWSAQNMLPTDSYVVSATPADREDWVPIASVVNSSSVAWNVDLPVNAEGYRFRLKTSRGHAMSTPEAVLLRDPVEVIRDPESVTACEGERVELSVEAVGSGLLWQWRRNGRLVAGATQARYVIPSLSSDFEGEYDVQVYGGCGMARLSSPAIVRMIEAAAFASQPKDIVQESLQPIIIDVDAVGSVKQLSLVRDGGVVATSSTLRLSIPSSPQLNGTYSLLLSGDCGSVESSPFTISVRNDKTSVYGSSSTGAKPILYRSAGETWLVFNEAFAGTVHVHTLDGVLVSERQGVFADGMIAVPVLSRGTYIVSWSGLGWKGAMVTLLAP
jgi:hypothetical protein